MQYLKLGEVEFQRLQSSKKEEELDSEDDIKPFMHGESIAEIVGFKVLINMAGR